MTYNNPKAIKEYQRLWYLKKIGRFDGDITKEVKKKFNIKSQKVYDEKIRLKKKRQWSNECNKRNRVKRKQIKDKLGTKCYICGRTFKRMATHKKDGKEHKNFLFLSNKDYETALKSGDYVILCYRCHKGVHFCMDILHFDWNQILNFV